MDIDHGEQFVDDQRTQRATEIFRSILANDRTKGSVIHIDTFDGTKGSVIHIDTFDTKGSVIHIDTFDGGRDGY